MASCAYIKGNNERCKAQAMTGFEWCYVHNPAMYEKRKRTNRKGGLLGGRGRGRSEIDTIKAELRELVGLVRDGEMDRAVATVIGQLYNTMLRAIETEGRLKQRHEIHEEQFTYEAVRMWDIIKAHVKDQEALDAILNGIEGLAAEAACPRCFEQNHAPLPRRPASRRY